MNGWPSFARPFRRQPAGVPLFRRDSDGASGQGPEAGGGQSSAVGLRHEMFTPPEAWDATLRGNAIRRRETMPEIIVAADREHDRGEGAVMLRERINLSDFESATFAQRL